MPQTVTLRATGVEYIHWPVTGLPPDPPVGSIQVSLDSGASWADATLDGTVVSLLVAHPDATSPDPAAVVAGAAGTSTEMLVRFTDTPEVVIRSGGWLSVAR